MAVELMTEEIWFDPLLPGPRGLSSVNAKIVPETDDFFFIIHSMNNTDEIVSNVELKRNTGEHGMRMWIACNGMVYDVTECPKWRTGLHEFLHFAGQDLTSEFPEAPHKLEVFTHDCVQIVGKLQTET
jgi:predicted heme/steroid binding protein